MTKLGPATNAFARTTTAITMVNGGFKVRIPLNILILISHK